MTQRRVIALHGAQGAGKDAIADYLVEQHGFTRFAFADRLREACEVLDPIVGFREDLTVRGQWVDGSPLSVRPIRLLEAVNEVGWSQAKFKYPEVRRTLQRLATEVIRDFVSETFWADYVVEQSKDIEKVVISDMRFASEWETITDPWGPSYGASVEAWWVTRPNNPHDQRVNHRSEEWHPEIYRPILNSGTLTDLSYTVATALDGAINLVTSSTV